MRHLLAMLLISALVAGNSSAQLQTMQRVQLTAQNSAVFLLYPCILQSIYATEGSRPIPKPPLSVKHLLVKLLGMTVKSPDNIPSVSKNA